MHINGPAAGMRINGLVAHGNGQREVLNPATGALVGMAPIGSIDLLDAAIAAARAAQPQWRATSDGERAQKCRDMAAAIAHHAPQLALLLTREQGKPLSGMGSQFEVGGCSAWLNATADMQLPVKILQDDAAARVEQHYEPVGVIGSITPWNWPLMIAIWHLAPAIRSGNCVVLKPSPYTTLSTLRLVEIVADILPPGVLNCVADGPGVGEAMSAHHDIDKIIFTGSTQTGRRIMEAAAPTLKILTLEMGGNDAGIVLPDADVSALAEGMFWGAFINGGQTCAAMKRLYVHDDIYDAVCDALVQLAHTIPMGNGENPDNLLGPIQNEMQFNIVKRLVDAAVDSGARILSGGSAPQQPGYFYPITLLADATEDMAIVTEEQFGPALPIIRYTDIDDAIRQANGLDVGLAASVWSADHDAAMAVAAQLEAGTVYFNKHGEVAPHIPFGGVKNSSIGVEFGIEGLQACNTIKIYNMAK